MRKIFTVVCILSCLSLLAQTDMPVKEMIGLSDNIFIGSLAGRQTIMNEKGMPLTQNRFNVRAYFKAVLADSFIVQTAGGERAGKQITVSHTPHFQNGKMYLVFSASPHMGFTDPVMGNYGILELITDAQTGIVYIKTQGDRFITGIENNHFITSNRRIEKIENGVPVYKRETDMFRMNTQPVSVEDAYTATSAFDGKSDVVQQPLSYADFCDYLKREYGLTSTVLGYPRDISDAEDIDGHSISSCGRHTLNLVMEQLPTNFTPWHGLNDTLMAIWNNYMDIYRNIPTNGSWGDNNVNEFGGYPTSTQLINTYGSGYGWGPSTLALTISYINNNCGVIDESDIFVNPDRPFTNDLFSNFNGGGSMYAQVITHELGHAWGFMTSQTETYDYDLPTAMQGSYTNIVEDGRGIHCKDAYLMRLEYTAQRSVLQHIDMGVESYYASNGLVGSIASDSVFSLNDLITVYAVTVENMSPFDVANVHLSFYLSQDISLSQSDYLMIGSPYYWTKFDKEAYSSSNYLLRIPANVPSGKYYILMAVTYNETLSDSFAYNNVTFLKNRITINGLTTGTTEVNDSPDNFNIRLTGSRQYSLVNLNGLTGSYRVTNSIGQTLHTGDFTATTGANFSVYTPGLYLVEVITNDRREIYKVLVK